MDSLISQVVVYVVSFNWFLPKTSVFVVLGPCIETPQVQIWPFSAQFLERGGWRKGLWARCEGRQCRRLSDQCVFHLESQNAMSRSSSSISSFLSPANSRGEKEMPTPVVKSQWRISNCFIYTNTWLTFEVQNFILKSPLKISYAFCLWTLIMQPLWNLEERHKGCI